MKIIQAMAFASLLLAGSAASVAAQAGPGVVQPAELPPGSYNERQYIDSDGCVFARIEVDGNVLWAPRVSPARKVVCGQQPSFAPRVSEAMPDPQPEPQVPPKAAAKTHALPEGMANETPKAALEVGAPAPRIARKPAIQPRSAPVPVAITPVVPLQVWRSPCRVQGAQVPQHGQARVSVSESYKRVWMVGRLHQLDHQDVSERQGAAMMWTDSRPRRLILTDTGREMSAHYPDLVYPYTSYEAQCAARAAARKASGTSAPAKGQNYVQVGAFHSNAQVLEAAQRLAGADLPTSLGAMTRNGRRYSLLLAGPFASADAAEGALAQLREAGFANARLR